MVQDKLNSLIMESMKAHDEVRTESLRAIKSAFLNWKTAKENVGRELEEAAEIQVLKKLVKQRQESADMYKEAGRNELAEHELEQMAVIKEFLPADVSEEQIKIAIHNLIVADGLEPIKKNMGLFVKGVKEKLPTADGKLVATIVQRHLS